MLVLSRWLEPTSVADTPSACSAILDGAIEGYTKAIDSVPNVHRGLSATRNLLLLRQEAYDQALQDFVAAANRDPYQLDSRAMFWSGLTNAQDR